MFRLTRRYVWLYVAVGLFLLPLILYQFFIGVLFLPLPQQPTDILSLKDSPDGVWFESLYNITARTRHSHCYNSKRFGDKENGRIVCLDNIRADSCVLYSLGVTHHFSFEVDVFEELGCSIHYFNCASGTIPPSVIPSSVTFHSWCIGDENDHTQIADYHRVQTYTFPLTLKILGHEEIDVLKMDVQLYGCTTMMHIFKTAGVIGQILFGSSIPVENNAINKPSLWNEWKHKWDILNPTDFKIFSHEINPSRAYLCEWSLQKVLYSTTLVTAYFDVPSKSSQKWYHQWMQNMLSLQDAMVIYTTPNNTDLILNLRKHALNRTVIINLALNDLPVATKASRSYWEFQLSTDYEKYIHKSFELFWIWLSKPYLVERAIFENHFSSNVFVWVDIGCFRDDRFNGGVLVNNMDLISDKSLLIGSSLNNPVIPSTRWIIKEIHYYINEMFVAGAIIAGSTPSWRLFVKSYESTLQSYIKRYIIELFLHHPHNSL